MNVAVVLDPPLYTYTGRKRKKEREIHEEKSVARMKVHEKEGVSQKRI